MRNRLQGQNAYITNLVSATGLGDVSVNAADDKITFSASDLNISAGWLYIDYDNTKKDLIKFFTEGGVTKYYKKDRLNPSAVHLVGAKVQINDVTERINYLSNTVDDFGYVDILSGLHIKVSGGKVQYDTSNTVYTINDTEFTLDANSTYYIIFDFGSQLLSAVKSLTGINCRILANITTGASTITGNIDTRSVMLGSSGLSNSGVVTSVLAGNGMSFTTITGIGSVVLGTPSTINKTSTNATTTGTHSHALDLDGILIPGANISIIDNNDGTYTFASSGGGGGGLTKWTESPGGDLYYFSTVSGDDIVLGIGVDGTGAGQAAMIIRTKGTGTNFSTDNHWSFGGLGDGNTDKKNYMSWQYVSNGSTKRVAYINTDGIMEFKEKTSSLDSISGYTQLFFKSDGLYTKQGSVETKVGGGPSLIVDFYDGDTLVNGEIIRKPVSAFTLNSVMIGLETKPTGADFKITVKKNGTSVLSGTLDISTSESASNSIYTVKTGDSGKSTVTTTSFNDKDRLTVEITQTGSGTVGSGLSVQILGTYL